MSKNAFAYEGVLKLARAESILEAWQLITMIREDAGFDSVVYGTNRLRGPGVFGDHADSFILSDAPKGLMGKLWNQRTYLQIPVVLWAMENCGEISFQYGSDLYHAGKLDKAQTTAQQQMMQLGVTSGYAVGLHSKNSVTASIIAFVNFGKTQEECDQIWANARERINTFSSVFHLKVSNLPLPLSGKKLTPRQTEVLRWVGQGKTMSETATILGVAPATVEKHLRQARETLGVTTTTQAVLHAQIVGQIFSVKE